MRFAFRPLMRSDFGELARWLAQPYVARWWNHQFTPEAIETDLGDAIDGVEAGENFIAELDSEPIGLIQFSRFVDYPEYPEEMAELYGVGDGCASIDYLIGQSDLVGRGLGARMIAEFVGFVWTHDPTTTHLVVPVNSTNEASWRALKRAGFRLVARGELGADHPSHDWMHEVFRIDRPCAG